MYFTYKQWAIQFEVIISTSQMWASRSTHLQKWYSAALRINWQERYKQYKIFINDILWFLWFTLSLCFFVLVAHFQWLFYELYATLQGQTSQIITPKFFKLMHHLVNLVTSFSCKLVHAATFHRLFQTTLTWIIFKTWFRLVYTAYTGYYISFKLC